MNNSLELSKQLLEIVNLPPEKRNDALMQFLIYIEEVQYDMNTEQKNLLISIVNDLILENNAQQIVKSKLVFLKNKDEEIAPSKKTKEKKVIVPVVEKIEEDTSFYPVDDDDEIINKEEIVLTKPIKEVTPKVVAPKKVKTKTTKTKVEADLSFLNDLDNIF